MHTNAKIGSLDTLLSYPGSMKLRQLWVFAEVAREGFNLTRAAERMSLSQPALTRQLQGLEADLGVPLLTRSKGRFIGLTRHGEVLLPMMNRALESVDDIQRVAKRLAEGATSVLTVGTANTHAQYSLPEAIRRFVAIHPDVMLRLRQGTHQQAIAWARAREVDFSISTRPDDPIPDLLFFPCYDMHRTVLTLPGHPLHALERVTLADIARYPVITYDRDFPAHVRIARVFEEQGLRINVALSGTDTETVKRYVLAGLGIGIVGHTAYDPRHDPDLRAIDVRHLLGSSTAYVTVPRDDLPSALAMQLIELFSPRVHAAMTEALRRVRPDSASSA